MSASALLDRDAAPMAAKAELRGEMSAKQPQWLSGAIADQIHASRGTVKALAAVLGVRERAVYEAADRNNPKPTKLWWLEGICQATGFGLLDTIERRLGRVAFSAPIVDSNDSVMQQALAREVTAFGEFLTETAADVADNRIDAGELQRILPAIEHMLARTCEFRSMVIEKARLDAAVAR